jgi:carboxypeptidase Taq
MKEHVWAKADRLSPQEWIKDITGREFTPVDFLDYLESKYSAIYEL